MAKRTAATPLHQDNWDQESDKEEAGSFTSATSEEMRNRTVKKARRLISTPVNTKKNETNAIDSTNQKSNTNVLSGFTGFTTIHNSNASNLFHFDINPPKTILPVTEVNGNSTTTTTTTANIIAPSTSSTQSTTAMTNNTFTSPITTSETDSTTLKQATTVGDFFRRLRVLNEAVVKWITMHVQQNPHCVLTPVFRDYEKYYSEMEQRFPNLISVTQPNCPTSLQNTNPTSINSASPSNVLRRSPLSVECIRPLAQAADVTPGHISGGRNVISVPPTTAVKTQGGDVHDDVPVVVGIPSTNSIMQLKPPKMNMLNTSLSTPKLTFASAPLVTEDRGDASEDEEEAEDTVKPQEVVPVEEEGSFYSKKCKLFYKHEGTFIEKGIGMLHLKKLEEKLQLVVRADTNLGNILLNIIVNPSFPMQRMGKNNVMICCVPNPPLTAKMEPNTAIPLLIRVSSAEDADELLDKLKSSS